MTLIELAERCEAATGPDRRLDAEIEWTSRGVRGAWYVTSNHRGDFSHVSGWWRDAEDASHKAPDYTASIDAALTLVPEGAFYGFVMKGDVDGFDACCQFAGPDEDAPELIWHGAANPALALCAAALKARASTEGQTDE